ncbi:S1C family serine protease [Piscibacillus halophilus]|uniref:Trypsin-like peptidase domain-containing protein n=1 Tax=Piscibacillus halophilus TaxID=571933 RepID=A0A1H9GX98_9BACI|nr:trypsin-like peptidase domain-containing protein [Piscibacillus halophilus]SEQ54638.1 Trypsin-like peptidase domain-containing protein [Piscibacillus halophilus]
MLKKQNKVLPISLSVAILILGILAIFLYYNYWEDDVLATEDGMIEIVENEEDHEKKDLQTIIHEAEKNVVYIEAVNSSSTSEGSGFLFNDKGDIVTNAHVVKNATDIYVKTSDGTSTYPGALIDLNEKKDVAVIRVPQLKNQGTMEIDPNFEPNIGDEIIAVGSPHGFQGSFTDGIISAKNRNFSINNSEYENLYQVSASISQGNSGGPLIHKDTGLIIGINAAASKEGNFGFTIPISQVYDLIQMWSDVADDEELSFEVDPNSYQSVNPDSLVEDAEYIVRYYYDTLNVRDYFAAYSLLGSNEQIKRSYQEFRDLSVKSIDIELPDDNFEIDEPEGEQVKVNVFPDHHIRKDDDTLEIHHYKTTFEVGYENDQLKILLLERELLSKTEQKIEKDEEDAEKNEEENDSEGE